MKHFPKLLVCLLVTALLTSCASNASLIEKGDQAYESGDYKTALSEYKQIHGEIPEDTLRKMVECSKDDATLQRKYLEELYTYGSFTNDEYKALAAYYTDEEILQKRNLLEDGYRVYHDAAVLELLDTIVIDLDTEEESVKTTLLGYISDYTTVDLDYIASLFTAKQTERKYTSGDNRLLLDKNGIQLWLKNNEEITYVRINNEEYFVGHTKYSNDAYNGAFDLVYASSDKKVSKEEGTFTNDLCTGAITSTIYQTAFETVKEAYEGYSTVAGSTYTGSFDGNGVTTAPQKTGSGVTYATIVSGKTTYYLYLEGVSSSGYIFTGDSLGFRLYPKWEAIN